MRIYCWDASALIKRYFIETGSDTVDAIFAQISILEMITTPWGYTETFSILVRRLNEKILNQSSFSTASTALQSEVVYNSDFRFLPVSDKDIFASIATIYKHSLNATDSAILTTILEYQKSSGNECVLISCDKRLIRSAELEGLKVINPQILSPDNVADILINL